MIRATYSGALVTTAPLEPDAPHPDEVVVCLVLATGGLGQVFSLSTNPAVATGERALARHALVAGADGHRDEERGR